MAGGTVTGNRCMIKVGRYPAAGGMAIGKVIGADDMTAVFAGGDTAVVTTYTGPLHMRVVHTGGGSPGRCCMATLAHLGGLDMPSMLACGGCAVVAARTIVGYAGMVVSAGAPGYGVVAIFAGSTVSGDMRWRHAGGDGAIMTTDAGTPYRCVIDTADAGPAHGGVAGFAAVVRSDMQRILTRRNGSVMARAAITGDITMIKDRMTPVNGGMAVIALIVTRYVSGRLTL